MASHRAMVARAHMPVKRRMRALIIILSSSGQALIRST
jgi:hypothetical protein